MINHRIKNRLKHHAPVPKKNIFNRQNISEQQYFICLGYSCLTPRPVHTRFVLELKSGDESIKLVTFDQVPRIINTKQEQKTQCHSKKQFPQSLIDSSIHRSNNILRAQVLQRNPRKTQKYTSLTAKNKLAKNKMYFTKNSPHPILIYFFTILLE